MLLQPVFADVPQHAPFAPGAFIEGLFHHKITSICQNDNTSVFKKFMYGGGGERLSNGGFRRMDVNQTENTLSRLEIFNRLRVYKVLFCF